MPEENQELINRIKLPVNHEKCPVCGSTKRLIKTVVDNLKDDKVLPQNYTCEGMLLQAALFDPAHPPTILSPTFTIKVINAVIEFCGEEGCGAAYIRSFAIADQPAQLAPKNQGNARGGPGLGPHRAN